MIKEKRGIKALLFVSLAMAILLPAYDIYILFPSFDNIMIDEKESDARLSAAHLAKMFMGEVGTLKAASITPHVKSEFEESAKELHLAKLKVFSAEGEVIYSTDPADMGHVNREEYFVNKISKGKPHTVYVKKGGRSMEGGVVVTHVVETYVPIMFGGDFLGAFEFYYDMTPSKDRVDVLIRYSSGLLIFASFLFSVIIVMVSKQAIRAIDRTDNAHAALGISEEKFSHIFKFSPDWLILKRFEDFKVIDVNEALLRMTGYNKGELIGRRFDESGVCAVPAECAGIDNLLREKGEVMDREVKFRSKSGEIYVMLMSAETFNMSDGKYVMTVCHDITERKRAEENETRLHKELKDIFDNIPVGIAYLDRELNFLTVNKRYARLTGIIEERAFEGRPYMDAFKRAGYDSASDMPRIQQMIGESKFSGRSFVFERRNGGAFIKSTVIPETDESGNVYRFMELLEDVTDQRRAEQKILSSLKEKDVLLKEIHHRVKNNLQIVSSLLNLQSRNAPDSETLELFRESQGRVRSMALIHEGLYRSADLARIDFNDYIRNLTTHLMRTYALDASRVKLKLDVQGVVLGVDLAVPCGLLINELVSNSFKYAFPGGRSGEIAIEFRADDGEYVLRVSDDGAGFPDEVDLSGSKTLGLSLVKTLTEQIGGRLDHKSGGGRTEFVVRFPKSMTAKGDE